MAYCTTDGVEIGNVPLPRGFNKQYFVDQAADEIDTELGKTYKLPLTPVPSYTGNPLTDGSWTQKLLEKINRYLAIGRIMINAASPGEDNSLNSYGYYHIKQANDALAAIVKRDIELPFVLIDKDVNKLPPGPNIQNREPASFVDAFYQQSVGNEEVSTEVYPNNFLRPWGF